MTTPVQAPEGGRIHILRVPVNHGNKWDDAIDAAGPDTNRDWEVRKVGSQYPPLPCEPRDEEIILVSFDKAIPDTQHAIDWGKQFGLVPKQPRSVFAVAEYRPKLHHELGVSAMGIISLVPCTFEGRGRVCRVWLRDGYRRCGLPSFDGGWLGHSWFAFGREE
jgi:hypothetical protein